MQAGLSAADRKLLLGAGLVLLVLLAGLVAFAPAAAPEESVVPTIWSTASGGARAAYLLLLDLRYPVHRWEESPLSLTAAAHGVVLILAEPTETPSKKERTALSMFVQSGGRVLFCGPALKAFFPQAEVLPQIFDPEAKQFTPNLPSWFTRGAQKVIIRPRATWHRLTAEQLALYGDTSAPAIVAWRMGEGELLWWTSATPLTNAGITQADNLQLFMNSVSAPPSEDRPTILWDEYFHGQRGSLWNYIERTPVVWGLVQIAFIAMGVLFTFSRRSGPIAVPAAVSRLSPLEFVDTLGGLYQRAGASSLAVEVSGRHLRTKLTRQLGLPAAVSNEILAASAGQRLGWNASQLAGDLEGAATAGRADKLPPRKALGIVQALERYLSRLDIRRSTPPEKN